jgi:Transposase family tnp2
LQDDPWDGIRDYWDGILHQEHKARGFFADERDIALGLSTDGLQLFKVGKYSVWPLLLVNFNLKPDQRVKKHNIFLCGIIPGPNNPKDIHSFLRVMVDELKELAIGIEDVYDAFTKTQFTLRAHLVLVSGDLPAIAKVMGISGHNSYHYCRFCTLQGVHHGHIYCPLRAPDGYAPEHAFNHDPANLTLRNNPTYRQIASDTLESETFNPFVPSKPPYGVAQYSTLYELDTIDFPRSFPIDVMHLIYENVVPKMFRWWTGEYLKKDNEDEGDEDDELAIPKRTWSQIGQDMEDSRMSIPTSYGRALRNIYTYHGSFKAEEWSNFLLYYSPVLLHGRDRLRRDLFEHYCKLIAAIELAIDYDITFEDIDRIKALLVDFVSGYEELYYQYDEQRINACLPTFHLLLHLSESLSNCGPAWVFWQFPCERVCGMLKPMVKSRVFSNRNLSLAILYKEQFNHLSYATPSWTMPPHQPNPVLPRYVKDIEGHIYSFLHPRIHHTLSPQESTHLVRYYANLFQCTTAEINLNHDFDEEIIKWGRCLLTGDVDGVSSEWNDLRRDLSMSRTSSVVRLSQQDDNGQPITQFGKVIHFFIHKFRDTERMLAYIQIYRTTDLSLRYGCSQINKILQLNRVGSNEVVGVTAIDEGIGIMKNAGISYLLVRRRMSETED